MLSIGDIQRLYKTYIETRDKNEQRRDYLCVATSIGAIGVWHYHRWVPEYLPSVAVVCCHSLLNHTAVYNLITDRFSRWVFRGRNLRTVGNKFLTETGIYMAADYAVIKWLSPQFMPIVHKYIIRLRWIGLVVGGISGLAVGSLYIPWVQNLIVKYLADAFRQAPQLGEFIRVYSGMPINRAAMAEPKIPYSTVADLVTPNNHPTDVDDITCSICMQDYNSLTNSDKTHLIKTRECAHVFCVPCIEAWLNINAGESVRQAKYCPMCRTPIIELKDLSGWNKVAQDDGLEAHIRGIFSNFRI